MKKDESLINVSIMVGPNFHNEILELMNDEFDIACKKWGLKLNLEDKTFIIEQSVKQLESKVSFLTKNVWTISHNIIKASIITTKKDNDVSITLPTDSPEYQHLNIMRAHDHWRIEPEKTTESIGFNSFGDYFLEEIRKWARTAVFYGVGSYA